MPRLRLPRPLWIALATAVLVVVAVGLLVGVPAYRQHLAIREIERIGGAVETEKGGPDWLRRLIGDERMTMFDPVVAVYYGKGATDSTLGQLEPLTELRVIGMDFAPITDAGLVRLRQFRKLEFLSLNETLVTDAGLLNVRELSTLSALSLFETQVSDAGVECLLELPRLEWLNIIRTQITDAGLERLTHHSNIQFLGLDETQISDAGLAHLQGMIGLRTIVIWDITDVTEDRLVKIREALPDCEVIRGGPE